ncbi:type IV pilus major pilin [Shewanella sp. MMG014]|uniref:type II secretion system protein n=1 Tax=Shewanella sp. MMG014 TaxID=2822691 RepID=UPI001B382422|nr:type II secretion system protein [Shewanella sp. MMG014]MBQ4889706.1 type IV pilus major pilin [Shewanella sp. MMG014]
MLYKKNSQAKKQRGVALLELIIAIGVIGVLTAAVVGLASQAFTSLNQKELVNNLSNLKSGISTVYGRFGDYSDIATVGTDGRQIGGAYAADDLNNPFGIDLAVLSASVNSNADTGYVVKVAGLGIDECIAVVNQIGTTWDFVYVGTASTTFDITATVADEIIYSNSDSSLFTPANILTQCSTASVEIALGSR